MTIFYSAARNSEGSNVCSSYRQSKLMVIREK